MLAREVQLSQALCPHSDPLPVTECLKALNNITYETYNKQRNIQAEELHFDGAIHPPINVGDMVLIQKSKSRLNKPGKLDSRYSGPYKIVKRLDFVAYVIDEMGKDINDPPRDNQLPAIINNDINEAPSRQSLPIMNESLNNTNNSTPDIAPSPNLVFIRG